MKRKVKLILGILLISTVGFLGYKIIAKIQQKKVITDRIEQLPNFSFKDVQGNIYTQENVNNTPLVFVYFHSECVYCQSEATKIKENIEAFNNVQLVFVSYEDTEVIEEFAKIYGLYNQKSVIFLEDTKMQFSTIFNVQTIPYTIVYNAEKKFVKQFKGAVKIDKIIEALD